VTNQELAAAARAHAALGGPDRPAWLTAAVALGTTRSVPAARRALRSAALPGPVAQAALAALGQLYADAQANAAGLTA